MAEQTGVAQEQPVAAEPRYVVHSAETYVHEPADLWTSRLDNGLQGFGNSPMVMENINQLYAYLQGRSDGAITRAKVEAISQ